MIHFDIETWGDRLLAGMAQKFFESASPDFMVALCAGCEIEFGSEMTPEGFKVTARTKNPVAVVRDGGRIAVYEAPHGKR